MMNRVEKTFPKWALALICAGMVGAAEAATETVYKPVWSQTFEDENLTLADLASQGFSLSDTSGSAIYLDTRYTSTVQHEKFLHMRKSVDVSSWPTLTFTSPSDFSVTTAYTVEFDWFYCTGYGQKGSVGNYGYIDVYGSNSADWLFRMQARADTYSQKGYLAYNGDTTKVTEIDNGARGGDPTSKDYLAYWYHFVISGTPNGATKLNITKGDGTAVATDVTLSEDFITVTSIKGVVGTKSYNENGGIDNIILKVPSSASAYTWTNATGDGCWTTAANWTVDDKGTVALSMPSAIDEVSIPASSVVRIPASGVSYAKLTLGEGAKLGVMFETVGDTFTIPDDLTASDIKVVAPFAATTEGSVLTATRSPTTYTWNKTSSDYWFAKNFLVENEIPCVLPLGTDEVIIPAAAAGSVITTRYAASLGKMTLNGDVTFTGSATINTVTTNALGQGKLILDGINCAGEVSVTATIKAPVEVKNSVYIDRDFDLYGVLTGDGSIECTGSSQPGFRFHGDTSGFHGSYTGGRPTADDRDATQFLDEARGSASATWDFTKNDAGSTHTQPFGVANATYQFGALTSSDLYLGPKTGITVEVGGLASSVSSIIGRLIDDSNKFRKVGATSTCTLYLNDSKGTLEVNAGTLTHKGMNPKSAVLSGATATLVTTNTIVPTVASTLEGYRVVSNVVTAASVTTVTYAPEKMAKLAISTSPVGCENIVVSNANNKVYQSDEYIPVGEVLYISGKIVSDYTDITLKAGDAVVATAIGGTELAGTHTVTADDAANGLSVTCTASLACTLTIPIVEHVEVSVTTNGASAFVTKGSTAYAVIVVAGSKVEVTYTAENAFALDDATKKTTIDAMSKDTTIETTDMPTATRTPTTFTWAGTDGDWSKVSNWTANDKPVSVLPSSSDTVVFDTDATVRLSADPAFSGAVQVKSGTLVLPYGTTLTKVTVSDGASLTADLPYAVKLTPETDESGAETGNYKVEVVYDDRVFIWDNNGGTGDGLWTTYSNWMHNGKRCTNSGPGSSSTCWFPSNLVAVTMNLAADISPSNIVADAELTLAGGKTVKFYDASGSGKLILAGVTLGRRTNPTTIHVDLSAAEGTTSTFNNNSSSTYTYFYVYGSLTGKGKIVSNNSNWNGVWLYGDTSGFEGEFESKSAGTRNHSGFGSEVHGSSNAVWRIYDQTQSGVNHGDYIHDSKTYCFGALIGGLAALSNKPTYEIGLRDDVDSEAWFTARYSGSVKVNKFGKGKLTIVKLTTYDYNDLARVNIKGGTVDSYRLPTTYFAFEGDGATLVVSNGLAYATSISNSTSAVRLDTAGKDITLTGSISDSNQIAEIQKVGEGKLALDAPAWSTTTVTVLGGSLTLPAATSYTLGANTKVNEANTDTTVIEFVQDTSVVEAGTPVTISASSAAAATNAAEAVTITLSETATAAGQQTSYFKKVVTPATDAQGQVIANSYTVSVVLDEKVVEPNSTATTMELSSTQPTIEPGNVKKGLWYSMATFDSPDASATATVKGTPVQATGDSVSVTAGTDSSTSNVRYYRVLVGDTEDAVK